VTGQGPTLGSHAVWALIFTELNKTKATIAVIIEKIDNDFLTSIIKYTISYLTSIGKESADADSLLA